MTQVVVTPYSEIDMIDLEPYKWKLSRKHPELTMKDLEILDLEYRRFLMLKISYPTQEIFTYKGIWTKSGISTY